jgi:hypothetical protein
VAGGGVPAVGRNVISSASRRNRAESTARRPYAIRTALSAVLAASRGPSAAAGISSYVGFSSVFSTIATSRSTTTPKRP